MKNHNQVAAAHQTLIKASKTFITILKRDEDTRNDKDVIARTINSSLNIHEIQQLINVTEKKKETLLNKIKSEIKSCIDLSFRLRIAVSGEFEIDLEEMGSASEDFFDQQTQTRTNVQIHAITRIWREGYVFEGYIDGSLAECFNPKHSRIRFNAYLNDDYRANVFESEDFEGIFVTFVENLSDLSLCELEDVAARVETVVKLITAEPESCVKKSAP